MPNNKVLCSCFLCKNTITTNQLPVHYGSKQCLTGELFSQKAKRNSNRSLNCSYCSFIGKNANSISQHENLCKSNSARISKLPSYGMKGKIGKGSNQYIKAKKQGLPPPSLSEDTKKKLRRGWENSPKAFHSKQGTQAIEYLLSNLTDIQYGKVQYANNGKEFWLKSDSGNFYFYDCCFRDLKIIIEFQGTAFHPKNLHESFRVPYKSMGTKESLWNKDRDKEYVAKCNGFIVEYIWSDNIVNDVNRICQIVRQKT